MKIIKNPNKEVVARVEKALLENDGYCPCRLVKTEEQYCMCLDFRRQIARGELGTCHCGLYVAEDTKNGENK